MCGSQANFLDKVSSGDCRTDNFMNNSGVASDFIKNRTYPGEIMNQMLVFMTDQKATGKDAAFEFLQKHENVWGKWVSDEAAKKIKANL